MNTTSPATRAYDNTSRAAAMTETRTAILRAAFDLTAERLTPEIVLADVANRAGTTVKTVLRHFGTREGLFESVIEFATREIADERSSPVGDVDAAIAAVHGHYELRADWVLRMLGQEHSDTRIRDIVETGRGVHREWVQATFAPQLAAIGADRRAASVDLLVVATDIYTWKILRRDIGLTAAETADRVRTLITSVLLDTLERN